MTALADLRGPGDLSLFGEPSSVSAVRLDRGEVNRLLTDWDHQLGPCDRPFGQDHHGLLVGGRLVAATVTASTVSSTVTDEHGVVWPRNQLVELARIVRDPGEPWVLRVMLRLWREVLAHEWEHWPAAAAVSYALPGRSGNLYRFDGWTFVRWTKPSSGGGTWSGPGRANGVGDGRKGLWIYRYPGAVRGEPT